ncbi:hypothetical protein [Amycolatopsis pigmentata]|uniref:Transposase n=1 Tax=Amycolatopsis pigmentata TaxID=450801 RepID=A0ABW5FQI2_9PSEU
MTLARHSSPPPSARFTEARAAEELHTTIQNARAARTVADHATDAKDCWRLLEMLGLDPASSKRG